MAAFPSIPGGRLGSSAREVIHIQVGKAGNQIGHEFWRDLCDEHRVEWKNDKRGTYYGDKDIYGEYLNVFFNEGQKGPGAPARYVPRAILVDLNMADLQALSQTPIGDLYKPDNIIGNDEGSGNCYAKAFHTEGPDLADKCLETVRKEVERCNCLQGVQFCHSVSGGTGSGLTGLMLKTLYDYLDKGSKCILQSFTLAPSPGMADMLLEPYNAALGLQDLLEYCHQVFFFDNHQLQDICQKTLEKEVPKMIEMNNIVALCMSGITSPLRFSGSLNSDLRKMQTNLVPFKNAHFLINSFAPLTAETNKRYKSQSVLDLTQQMISKDNVTVKCDPLNPGDPREGIIKARFLASYACWRGNMETRAVDKAMYELHAPNSRFDKFFPDWIPNCIASNICDVQHCEKGECVSFVSNNTSVYEVFDRTISNWDKMYRSSSYLHVFEQDGISAQDMMESRNILQYISDEYCEFARWEDKFFEDSGGMLPGSKPTIKDSAVENDEQRGICLELAELQDGSMYIKAAQGLR
jgi:tubulin beta